MSLNRNQYCLYMTFRHNVIPIEKAKKNSQRNESEICFYLYKKKYESITERNTFELTFYRFDESLNIQIITV